MAKSASAKSGYRHVRDEVLRRIRSGAWPTGSLLPGEMELAEEFGTARATVNRAMQELSDWGFVERKRKGGTRVRPAPIRQARFAIPLIKEEIEAKGARYGYRLLARRIIKVSGELRQRLNLVARDKVLHLMCLHSANGRPYQVESRWINLQTLPEAAEADFTATGPNEWLVARVPFTDVELAISATALEAEIAKALGARARAPGLLVERTTWLNTKTVTYVRLCFPASHKLLTRY